MSGDSSSSGPRSSVRVQRVRGGERVWQIVVVASDGGGEALREAVRLARELDDELTTVYVVGEPAPQDDDELGQVF